MKLLSPGIVRSPPNVLESLKFQHTFMHRNEEFHKMYTETGNYLTKMANCSNGTAMFVTGSGTSSMDVVINAIVNHGKTLFVSNGLFGERWQEIGFFYNKYNSLNYKLKWGETIDIEKLKECVKKHNIKYVVMVHCDTSVGIQNPIDKLKDLNAKLVVDAVSTFGAIDIDMDKMNIDILVTNPNKALASHMGLGIIIGKDSILETFEKENCGSYSLNLVRHYNLAKKGETCNSVSISCLNALREALKTYKRNDYESMFNRVYEKFKNKTLLERDQMCPVVITILDDDADNIIQKLYKNGFIVYPCKGQYEHKGYQVSFYGHDGTIENIKNLCLNLI